MQLAGCSVSEMVFHDPENFASAIKGARIAPCQLSGEPSSSTLVRVDFGSVCLDLVKAGPAMLYQGEMPKDCYTMSYVMRCEGTGHSFNFETDFSSGYMGFFPPASKLDATNPAGSVNAILTVRKDVFLEVAGLYVPELTVDVLPNGFGMMVGKRNREYTGSLLDSFERVFTSSEDLSVRQEACGELGRFLLPTYMASLREGVCRGAVKSSGRSIQRFQKFCDTRDYIVEHIKEPLFVEDLCQSASLSERGVENLFKDMAGTSPMAFLRLQRLQFVHHALLESAPCSGKVKELALAAGFSHMGHFSHYYHALFGESAGQTLAKGS